MEGDDQEYVDTALLKTLSFTSCLFHNVERKMSQSYVGPVNILELMAPVNLFSIFSGNGQL